MGCLNNYGEKCLVHKSISYVESRNEKYLFKKHTRDFLCVLILKASHKHDNTVQIPNRVSTEVTF
jgi:hypothetical protein